MSLRGALKRAVPRTLLWRKKGIRLAYAVGDHPIGNFGDRLSPMIIERLFGVSVRHSGMATAEMVSIGSLLEVVEKLTLDEKPVVWGTGFIDEGGPYQGRPVDVRAVRGRKSRERIAGGREGIALGDPGLLASIAFPEWGSSERKGVGIVPHFTDLDDALKVVADSASDAKVINPRTPVQEVIEAITSCEFIISSSLHGLIIADSFGIPNAWMAPGPGVLGGRYKFDDYYSAFEQSREPGELAELLKEWTNLRDSWQQLPDIEHLQRELIAAFPLARR